MAPLPRTRTTARPLPWGSLCALLCALPALADPAPAQLVEDINTAADLTSFPFQVTSPIVESGGSAFFVARTPETSYELWKSDGTSAGTVLVKDIAVGTQPIYSDETPRSLTDVNGTLFFIANDRGTGYELWKSDGTTAGTALVKDILAGSAGSLPMSLTNVNGTLFFTADDGVHGRELWKSDGTSSGTVLVKDLLPGAGGSSSTGYPSSLANVDGTLFFSGSGDGGAFDLWKSDGTEAGTVLVKDFTNQLLFELTGVGGRLFFWTFDWINFTPAELWTSDGTSAGTIFLTVLGPVDSEAPSAIPFFLTSVGGTLYFSNFGIWKSDGTVAGTTMVKDFSSSMPSHLTDVNSTLFFGADDGIHGYELWKSDGTEAGTVLVKDIFSGSEGSITPYYFQYSAALENVNGTLFLAADDGVHGSELWKSDGTETGTVLVEDINPGAPHALSRAPTNVNGTAFFSATALWKSDGTSAGTVKVKAGEANQSGVKIASGALFPGVLPSPEVLSAKVGGALFFIGSDSGFNEELWRSDGTAAGTALVKDIAAGSSTSSPREFANVNGALFFEANDGTSGSELWKSDGTQAGTVRVKDINPGSGGSNNGGRREITDVNGTAFFRSSHSGSDFELWKSDGTDAGTVRVEDIGPGSSGSQPRDLANIGGILFFAAHNGVTSWEPWRSDGTEAGTFLLKDILPGSLSSDAGDFTNMDGTAYFRARPSSTSSTGLWKSDGTTAGTVQVKGSLSPTDFTPVNGTLFFSAFELWKSDGTTAGTVQVKDIRPGDGSFPQLLTPANGVLFFAADDGTHGLELWKSDGTAAGTVLVEDIYPGLQAGFVGPMAAVGSRVVFAANDGVSAEELWTSDGTPAGTHLVADVAPNGGSLPDTFTEIGSLLLFSARTDALGRELYTVPIAALADGDQDGLEDQDEVALGTNPDDADSDDDGLTDGAEVNTHGTNPLLADTDGDGYSDGVEVQAGTDPLDPEDFPAAVPLTGPLGLGVLATLLLASTYAAAARRRSR